MAAKRSASKPSSTSKPARPSRFRRRVGLLLGGVTIVASCIAVRSYWEPQQASAQRIVKPKTTVARTAPAPKPADVMAVVNGDKITRADLGRDCLKRYGKDVLDSLINKELIGQHCRRMGMQITQQEIDAEVNRLAQRFGLPVREWLRMLEKERGIPRERYMADIIWPTLALRKVAKKELGVSPKELRAAFDTKYGPSVRVRMIVCNSPEKARLVHGKAVANPGQFGKLASEFSDDPNGRAWQGKVPPIRKHMGDENIEREAFLLQPGQISKVIQVDKQYVILQCEEHIPAQQMQFEQIKDHLEQWVREQKEPLAAAEVFKKLRKIAQIKRPFDDPEAGKRYPGVAAFVNNKTVTISQLANECIGRHGVEILESVIGRRLLEQHCRKNQIQVTKQDIDREVGRAAIAMGITDKDGLPEINRWLAMVEKEQGLTPPRYIEEIVWPTVALKKIVHKVAPEQVEVTREDMKRSEEANFGPRCRCRAIVLNNQRTAQDVWEMAHKNPNPIYFGQLAFKYSMDQQIKYLHGEVPPIRRHGGKPLLEKEAFSLKPGELSGIIQIGEQYVILLCEGYTKAQVMTAEERKDTEDGLYKDLYEKKLRIQMAKEYQRMTKSARIENFLANTRQSPKNSAAMIPRATPRR